MELNQFRDVDIVIDKINDNFIAKQFVSQGDKDGRTFTVQVTDGGVIGEIPGLTLNLRWRNESSGQADLSAFSVIDKTNSIFRIEYPQHMMVAGKVIANIQVLHDGKVMHTKPFEIIVQPLAGEMRGIVSQAEYSALVAALADANKLRTDIDRKASQSDLNYLSAIKADKTYVDAALASISAGGPRELFYSLDALKSKYPRGAEGTYLVFDASHQDGAHHYMWKDGAWRDLGIYQAQAIPDDSITNQKIKKYELSPDKKANPFVSMFRGKVTFDFRQRKIFLTNYDLIVEDFKTHPNTDNLPSIIDMPEQNTNWLYNVYFLLNDNNEIVSAAMTQFGDTPTGAYIFAQITNEDVFCPWTNPDLIEVINSAYRPRIYKYGILNDTDSIIFDKKNKIITFRNSVTIIDKDNPAKTYNKQSQPPIDYSNGNYSQTLVYAIVYDTINNLFKITQYNQIIANAYIIMLFKFGSDLYLDQSYSSTIRVINSEGYEVYPEKKLPAKIPIKNPKLKKYIIGKYDDIDIFDSVSFYGPWAKKTIDGVDCAYSSYLGGEIIFMVTQATTVSIEFTVKTLTDRALYVAVSVDGEAWTKYNLADNNTITLQVSNSKHYIRLMMQGIADNQTTNCYTDDYGFAIKSITSDGQMQAIKIDAPHIVAFGDSITEGKWITGKDGEQNDSATDSYINVAADLLGYGLTRVAKSAIGLGKSGQNGVPQLIDSYEFAYNGAPYMVPQADIIVINIGQNDATTGYQDNLVGFINQLMIFTPGAKIFVMVPFSQSKISQINAVASQLSINVIDTSRWDLTYTDGVHPDLAGHKKAGEKLAGIFYEISQL